MIYCYLPTKKEKMSNILFDENAEKSSQTKNSVSAFLEHISTLEAKYDMPVVIFQDGASDSYYIKCSISAKDATKWCDLNAKLDIKSSESYRANRQLFEKYITFQRMKNDAEKGREFNDIIVEYNTQYDSNKPLKVWGGQHRIRALSSSHTKNNRYHGFRIYFDLSKDQRTEVALISNTNIAVSNDTFDRIIEETLYGGVLRIWCQKVGFLSENKDFPDVGSRSEKISVKRARSFIVNYYFGKERGSELNSNELDRNTYEPYLTETGIKG